MLYYLINSAMKEKLDNIKNWKAVNNYKNIFSDILLKRMISICGKYFKFDEIFEIKTLKKVWIILMQVLFVFSKFQKL